MPPTITISGLFFKWRVPAKSPRVIHSLYLKFSIGSTTDQTNKVKQRKLEVSISGLTLIIFSLHTLPCTFYILFTQDNSILIKAKFLFFFSSPHSCVCVYVWSVCALRVWYMFQCGRMIYKPPVCTKHHSLTQFI